MGEGIQGLLNSLHGARCAALWQTPCAAIGRPLAAVCSGFRVCMPSAGRDVAQYSVESVLVHPACLDKGVPQALQQASLGLTHGACGQRRSSKPRPVLHLSLSSGTFSLTPVVCVCDPQSVSEPACDKLRAHDHLGFV